MSKTLDGVITSWNGGAERILGYPAVGAVGQHISLIIPEERRVEEDDVLARLRRGERVDHFETERRTKDGRRISISLTVSPIEDSKGGSAIPEKGIAPEFLTHISERFRQADGSSTRAQAGLGLGLAIIRHIVELHEGRVRAESPGVGQGAIFTVDLPLATPSADRGAAAGDETETAGLALGVLAGIRVSIVEDDADSRDLLATILAQEGAEVTVVDTVREALGATRHAEPDVIVCDLVMHGDDGFAFIAAIRSRSSEHSRAVPTLALTAYARPEDREAFRGGRPQSRAKCQRCSDSLAHHPHRCRATGFSHGEGARRRRRNR